MNIYLTWYYWYKNFGDELLLFWLLHILIHRYQVASIIIITPDKDRLQDRCSRHQELLDLLGVNIPLYFSPSVPFFPAKSDMLVIGWGEVMTDARSWPHNWRNYLFRYWLFFWRKKIILAWGFGTVKRTGIDILYKICLWASSDVLVREKYSFDIVSAYTDKVFLHRDFAYDVLDAMTITPKHWNYVVLNCNTHIFNKTSKEKIARYYHHRRELWTEVFFVAGTSGADDSDVAIYTQLKKDLPELQYYDRTTHTLWEICTFIAWAKAWLAARLHILLLLKQYNVSYDALVYQEKVDRLLQG